MVPTSVRGQLMSLNEVSVVTGSSLLVFDTTINFDALVEFIIPTRIAYRRWLVLQGRQDEALEALRFILEDEAASEQHQLIIATHPSSSRSETPAQIFKQLILSQASSCCWSGSCGPTSTDRPTNCGNVCLAAIARCRTFCIDRCHGCSFSKSQSRS